MKALRYVLVRGRFVIGDPIGLSKVCPLCGGSFSTYRGASVHIRYCRRGGGRRIRER